MNAARNILIVVGLLCLAAAAWARPVEVHHENCDTCDLLSVPDSVHELGLAAGGFSRSETIESAFLGITDYSPCPLQDLPDPNYLVSITNETGRPWTELWYVADVVTHISNIDGLVDEVPGHLLGFAFRIDAQWSDPLGSHWPLLSESLIQDGIFQPNETWEFVLQDYWDDHPLPRPELYGSLGIASASSGDTVSTGSIIAVPEPATLSLIALGGLALLRRRRQR